MYGEPPEACDECGDRLAALHFWSRQIPHWYCDACAGQQPTIQLTSYDGTEEDEQPLVNVECYGKENILRAVRDFSVGGCAWEFPDCRNVNDAAESGALGHAIVPDYPGLADDLRKEGYEVEDYR
jgi:hypothetical protein